MVEQSEKLMIVILTDKRERAVELLEVLEKIEWRNGTVKLCKNEGRLYANNVLYRCMKPSNCCGMRADQVILDDFLNYYDIAKVLLNNSCVPEGYQIIDAKNISFNYGDLVNVHGLHHKNMGGVQK